MFEKLLEAIVGLTAALNAHTAALGNADAAPAAGKRTRATKDTPPAGTTDQTTATQATQAATSQPAQSAATAATSSAAAETAPAVSAAEVAKLLQEVANSGPAKFEAAVAALASFGAKNFGGVKPSDYAALKAKLEAIQNPPAQTAASLM